MSESGHTFNYYAFISYSRRDIRAASFLHRKLEKFNYSVFTVEEECRPGDPKYLRKVFRDRTDLNYRDEDFRVGISRALKDSHYLIVVCSRHSRESVEVAYEIEEFLSQPGHTLKHVIPVILDGHVGKEDDPLPAMLRTDEILRRNLPVMMPEENETEKEAWENGLTGVIAAMTRIDRSQVHNRYLRNQKKRLFYWLQGSVTVLAGMIALTSWALHERNEAQEARARVEQEQKKTKALSDAGISYAEDIIFDFNERLLKLPNGTDIQFDLVNKSDVYLKVLEQHCGDDPYLWRTIGMAKDKLAFVYMNRGKVELAAGFYRQALDKFELLLKKNPDSDAHKALLINAYESLSTALMIGGEMEEAKGWLDKANPIREELLKKNPDSTELLWSELGSLHVEVRYYMVTYNWEKLMETCVKQLADAEKLLPKLTDKDKIHQAWGWMTYAYYAMGTYHMVQHDAPKVIEAYRKQLELAEKWYKEDSDEPDVIKTLVMAKLGIAMGLSLDEKTDEALSLLKEAEPLRERVLKLDPESMEMRISYIQSYATMGIAKNAANPPNKPKALMYLQKAKEMTQEALKISPNNRVLTQILGAIGVALMVLEEE